MHATRQMRGANLAGFRSTAITGLPSNGVIAGYFPATPLRKAPTLHKIGDERAIRAVRCYRGWPRTTRPAMKVGDFRRHRHHSGRPPLQLQTEANSHIGDPPGVSP